MRPVQFPKSSGHWVIFGSKSAGVPAAIADVVQAPCLQLGGFPSQHWTVTPAIEKSHRAQIESQSSEELHDPSNSELHTLIEPLLQERYSGRKGMSVAELGPATSTTVAAALSEPTNRYVSVEMSEPYAEKQMEFLLQDTKAQFYNVKGDTYSLPLVPGSCDLIVTSCHPPFYSASVSDKEAALDQVHGALKQGGEFLLFPFDSATQPAEFQAYIRQRFEIVEQRPSPEGGAERSALLLRKR